MTGIDYYTVRIARIDYGEYGRGRTWRGMQKPEMVVLLTWGARRIKRSEVVR